MSSILYIWNKDIPEYQGLEEQAQLLKKAYDIGIKGLQEALKQAEKKFEAKRTEARNNAKFEYFVSYEDKNDKRYYIITRKIINPLIGDTEFNKDIVYCSFRIVNSVIIMSGGGYQFQSIFNGDVISDDDISLLQSGSVPEVFKNRPIIDKKNLYLAGS
jgi:hypothetical protein